MALSFEYRQMFLFKGSECMTYNIARMSEPAIGHHIVPIGGQVGFSLR